MGATPMHEYSSKYHTPTINCFLYSYVHTASLCESERSCSLLFLFVAFCALNLIYVKANLASYIAYIESSGQLRLVYKVSKLLTRNKHKQIYKQLKIDPLAKVRVAVTTRAL